MRLLVRLTLALAFATNIGFGAAPTFAADASTAKKAVAEKPKNKTGGKKACWTEVRGACQEAGVAQEKADAG